MLIAIHRNAECPDGIAEHWAGCLAARGVDIRWVDLKAPEALHLVQNCDGVMWHWSQTYQDRRICRILQVIELQFGIPVFPNHVSSWHRRDKLAQYYLLEAAGVPMPKTWIFWDKQQAREWALQTDYPKVFKLSSGGGGKGVVLVRSVKEANHLIDRMFGPGISSGQIDQHLAGGISRFWLAPRTLMSRCKAAAQFVALGKPPSSSVEKGYVYFQEFVPGNDYKTGIIVVGNRAFGFLRFNEPNDFRSYGVSSHHNLPPIDLKCVQMAFDISENFGFSMMAYDFLLHHNEPVVLEINFKDATDRGYWKRNLEWVSKPISPQEAQVEVFLNSIRAGNSNSATLPTMSLS